MWNYFKNLNKICQIDVYAPFWVSLSPTFAKYKNINAPTSLRHALIFYLKNQNSLVARFDLSPFLLPAHPLKVNGEKNQKPETLLNEDAADASGAKLKLDDFKNGRRNGNR